MKKIVENNFWKSKKTDLSKPISVSDLIALKKDVCRKKTIIIEPDAFWRERE